jgi:purine catabolism regulator
MVTESAPEPADQLLVGHAVSLIALDQEKPRRARDERNRLGATLFGLLVDGNLAADRATEHLATVGLSLPVAMLAVLGTDPRRALATADRVLAEHDLPLLGGTHEECAVVLTTPELGGVLAGEIGAPAGLAAAAGPDGLPAALREAVTAARVARSRGVELVRFESLAGQVLSAEPATRTVLADLAEARLRPLADADQDLVGTLRAFLEHHGQWAPAATALGVHRHTLRGRMDRIRALLDVDLDSAHVRAELLLALVAWRN